MRDIGADRDVAGAVEIQDVSAYRSVVGVRTVDAESPHV